MRRREFHHSLRRHGRLRRMTHILLTETLLLEDDFRIVRGREK